MDREDKIITLSFDDKGIKYSRLNQRTIVSMVSYFRADKMMKFLTEMGYEDIPTIVKTALKSYGYRYDYKLNGWKTTTSGVALLDPRDSDDQGKANRIAITKAKVKAYDRAHRCFEKIKNSFANACILFDDSSIAVKEFLDDESEALDRVIETGYCNPDKK